MSQKPAYHTLKEAAFTELLIKKSRFLAQASPAATEEEALSFIKSIKDAHKTASHNCYAYIIGANAGLMRYQDDGEPQGTAGKPILEVLTRNNLVNCVCVVTRYFGGVLLGAGGLIRAYSGSAARAVRAAKIVLSELSLELVCLMDYVYWDRVNHALQSLPLDNITREFSDKVLLTCTARQKDADQVILNLTSLTDGSCEILASDPFFHQWETSLPEEDNLEDED